MCFVSLIYVISVYMGEHNHQYRYVVELVARVVGLLHWRVLHVLLQFLDSLFLQFEVHHYSLPIDTSIIMRLTLRIRHLTGCSSS